MSIEKLEEIKHDYTWKGNIYDVNVAMFMFKTIEVLKAQSDRIADIEQRLAQGYIGYENNKGEGTD